MNDPKFVQNRPKGETEPAPQLQRSGTEPRQQFDSPCRDCGHRRERPVCAPASNFYIHESVSPTTEDGDDIDGATAVEGGLDRSDSDLGDGIKNQHFDAVDDQGHIGRKVQDQPVGGLSSPLPAKGRPYNSWAVIRMKLQYPLAEWLGMTVFIFLGISANLAVKASEGAAGGIAIEYWAWGFAVMMGVYISGGGSGAFFNPSLTVSLSVFRGFPAKCIPAYVFAQVLGAFTGALIAIAIYKDDIMRLDGGFKADSLGTQIYTQPKDWISHSTAFGSEFAGATVLSLSIMALGDSGNSPPGAGMNALIIGLLTTVLVMSLSWNTGASLNPARDLGARLAALTVGYPSSIFTVKDYWWIWGPWGASISGSLSGALLYDICVYKGGESPVNYSVGRWKFATLRTESMWLHRFGRKGRQKARNIDKELEEGAQAGNL